MPFRTTGRAFDRGGKIPLVFHMERLEKMVRRRTPTMYFVNSLSDLFHEDAHDQQIAEVFGAIARAPQHTFQILTKRPERMAKLLNGSWFSGEVAAYAGTLSCEWPLPNVWLGVTIENRRFVRRADLLRQAPAAVRFISAEPLLGPLLRWEDVEFVEADGRTYPASQVRGTVDRSWWEPRRQGLDLVDVDWIICGGESGPGARSMDLQWARDLRDECEEMGVAFFMKQLGGARPGNALEDLPEDLRVRQYPRAA